MALISYLIVRAAAKISTIVQYHIIYDFYVISGIYIKVKNRRLNCRDIEEVLSKPKSFSRPRVIKLSNVSMSVFPSTLFFVLGPPRQKSSQANAGERGLVKKSEGVSNDVRDYPIF